MILIEKNIMNNTGFLGRVSHTTILEELSLQECVEFWGAKAKNLSAMENYGESKITGCPRDFYTQYWHNSQKEQENWTATTPVYTHRGDVSSDSP